MRHIQKQIKKLSMNIIRNEELIYIFGDLQDTPDDSKNFYYGKNKIAKHPLGIVKTCEDIGLQCTIYKQWNEIERPIISRHGSKGGRFIDGMYTCRNGLLHVQGITIIHDTGILRDHDMVITKCDLGIEKFQINKAKEERCDYRSIMNIPVAIKKGQIHPLLNTNVFKGVEYKKNKELYHEIQETINSPKYLILDEMEK
jgi:hypothetical protein